MIQTMKLTLCHMHVIDIVRHAGAKFEFYLQALYMHAHTKYIVRAR